MEVLSIDSPIISPEIDSHIKTKTLQTDNGKVPVPKDLKELITYLHEVFSYDNVDVDYTQKLLENYKSNPKEWRQYAKYDPHKYTRNLIDSGNGKFNILLLCWAESQGSSIHDHSNSHCFMKCLDGELLETKYEWPTQKNDDNEHEEKMKLRCKTNLPTNGVCYINDDICLHRVENLSHVKPAVSLHVYIPAFDECRGFNEQTGNSKTCKVTFHSKFGKKIDQV